MLIFDEFASKAAVAHPVVQMKAGALYAQLLPHLIALKILKPDAEKAKWINSPSRGWALSMPLQPAYRWRIFNRPEDWDDEMAVLRLRIIKKLSPNHIVLRKVKKVKEYRERRYSKRQYQLLRRKADRQCQVFSRFVN